jgi:hypothetical protein
MNSHEQFLYAITKKLKNIFFLLNKLKICLKLNALSIKRTDGFSSITFQTNFLEHNIYTLDLLDPSQKFVNKSWEDAIEIIVLSIADHIALSCLF